MSETPEQKARKQIDAQLAACGLVVQDYKLPDRQSIRLKGWDYTSPGWYFVTINTHENKALFGVVVNGRMVMSEAGRVAEEEWRKSAELRKGLVLNEFVVMPNHVHGIVRLQGLDVHQAPALASRWRGRWVCSSARTRLRCRGALDAWA